MNSANDLLRAKAHWETFSRLLTTLINEGLVNFDITLGDTDNDLRVRISPCNDSEENNHQGVLIRVRKESGYDAPMAQLSCPISPEELQSPLVVNTKDAPACNELANSEPETLFEAVFPWLGHEYSCKAQIIKELSSSARFQGKCFVQRISLPKSD